MAELNKPEYGRTVNATMIKSIVGAVLVESRAAMCVREYNCEKEKCQMLFFRYMKDSVSICTMFYFCPEPYQCIECSGALHGCGMQAISLSEDNYNYLSSKESHKYSEIHMRLKNAD